MLLNIKPTDRLDYMTHEEACSRCGKKFRGDEVPLRLWPQKKDDQGKELPSYWMYSYCEACTPEVLA